LFLETARRFLADEMPLREVRRLGVTRAGFERDWWSRAVSIGWTGMLVPEALGGAGQDVVALAGLAQEAGRAIAPGPLWPANLVIAALARSAGSPAGDPATLDGLLAGKTIATWAVCEPETYGWNPLASRVSARHAAGGYVIKGVKDRVEAASEADLFLVTADLNGRSAEFLLPRRTKGVSVTEAECIDIVRRYGVVAFDSAWVPADALVVGPDSAAGVIMWQSQLAALLLAAETLGAADRVFEFTLKWLFDRYSFGRPLASYQAIKHRIAQRKVDLEAMRAIANAAVTAVSVQSADSARLVSSAKSYIGDTAVALAQDCVQLHGAIGVTWEHDLHLYLRRLTVNRALYGSPEEHRIILGDLANSAASGDSAK